MKNHEKKDNCQLLWGKEMMFEDIGYLKHHIACLFRTSSTQESPSDLILLNSVFFLDKTKPIKNQIEIITLSNNFTDRQALERRTYMRCQNGVYDNKNLLSNTRIVRIECDSLSNHCFFNKAMISNIFDIAKIMLNIQDIIPIAFVTHCDQLDTRTHFHIIYLNNTTCELSLSDLIKQGSC